MHRLCLLQSVKAHYLIRNLLELSPYMTRPSHQWYKFRIFLELGQAFDCQLGLFRYRNRCILKILFGLTLARALL